MSENILPTHYHLEVYENSFVNDLSYFIKSMTPFMAISVGDYFNHRDHDQWDERPNTENEKFVIKQVEHIFWTIKGSHNGHKIMIVLEKEPYSW